MTCKAKNRICGLKDYTPHKNQMPRCYGKNEKRVFSCEGFETATDCENALDVWQKENPFHPCYGCVAQGEPSPSRP